MTKTKLVQFFKDQLETARINEDLAIRANDTYRLVKYHTYVKAYREAIYKTEQLEEN